MKNPPQLPSWLQRISALGGAGLFVVTFFDSSVLSFPFIADALVIKFSSQRPERMPYYAAMATLGSLAGSICLYWVAKKGGEAYFHRRAGRGALKARRWVDRNAFLSAFVPAILPPPFPFKIFVLAEGAFQVPLHTFVIAVLLGRGLRYFAVGIFGVKYGSQALIFLTTHTTAFAIGAVILIPLLYVLARFVFREKPERP